MIKPQLKYAETDEISLLKKFNNRESRTFGEVYNYYYKELYYYTSKLYAGTSTDAKDVIQDVFVTIWENRKLKFDSLKGIKSYTYVMIRNEYRMHYNHKKVIDKANRYLADNNDAFVINAAEAEIFSIIPSALDILPQECAKSFRLFLDGWDIGEIAEMLGKKRSTIYNQKNDSIEILRRNLSKFKLLFTIIMR